MATSDIYNADFFAKGERGMRQSAHAIAPYLYHYYLESLESPLSVIDVGCGEGWWLKEFADLGVKFLHGIDGHADSIAAGYYVKHDLAHPLTFSSGSKHDLCLCLETAEHLPPERAVDFIGELCELSDTVIFSAAIPHQGGNGHLNEQWQSYWATIFEQYGFGVSTWLRKAFWNDERIEPWYIQNILEFKRDGESELQEISVVHPRMWAIYRGK